MAPFKSLDAVSYSPSIVTMDHFRDIAMFSYLPCIRRLRYGVPVGVVWCHLVRKN